MNLLYEIKRLINEYEISPKRSLGQNFCIDDEVIRKMVSHSRLCKDDVVLEIGAGFGFLTSLLSENAGQVLAVEIDPKLLKALRDKMKDRNNVTILSGDILKVELPSFNKVVANPPYAISLALILRLLKMSYESATLTLQKEFVEKLIAQVGEDNYGFLTVVMNYQTQVNLIDVVLRNAFYPQPNVDSFLISMTTCKPRYTVKNEEFFFKLVRHLFTQRNKKLRNPLESFVRKEFEVDRSESKSIVESTLYFDTRVRDTPPKTFSLIANKLFSLVHSKRITVHNSLFYVFPQVYEPSDDTFLLAEHLNIVSGAKVLDMGSGSGVLGILSAYTAKSVVSADINPYAVECTAFNAKLNHIANKVDARLSDLFEAFPMNEKFDIIIFNPPYLPMDVRMRSTEWVEKAWFGGVTGRTVIDTFLQSVDDYLANEGRVLFIQSSLSKPEESLKKLDEMEYEAEIIAEKALFFEKLVVIRAKKKKTETSCTINP
jgi:16S rRNA (adenine1518-N6/adenine1519-N6)-dimethyltransferase